MQNLHFSLRKAKARLISEGILILVSLPTKGAKSIIWAENLNFLHLPVNKVFKFLLRGVIWHLFGKGTKVRIPSDIKSPLACCQKLSSITQWWNWNPIWRSILSFTLSVGINLSKFGQKQSTIYKDVLQY